MGRKDDTLRRHSVFVALFALLAALIPVTPAVAAASDLVAVTPTVWATEVEPGWAVAGSVRVSNTGGAAAKATQTRFYLSTDTKKSSSDVVLGSASTRAVKPKKSTIVSGGGIVGNSVPVGTYYFIACADQPSKNRERSERNNCKASSRTVDVVAPSAPAVPLDVAANLDASRAVTESVGPDGGTITARAADGTTFTLTIPKDALDLEIDITMTPVTAVVGLPITGELVGAVHLAPEAMQLYRMASLEIDPLDATTAADVVGFGAEQTGTDFYIDYTKLGSRIVLDLDSFSVHGVGTGDPTQPEQQGIDSEAEARRQTRAEFETQRSAGAETIDVDPLVPIAQEWFNRSVLPALMNGATGGAEVDFDAMILEYTTWLKYVHVHGLEDRFAKQIDLAQSLLEQTLFAAINEAARKCVANNDPSQITTISRYTKALESGLVTTNWNGTEILQEWMAKCVRFELKFETQLGYETFGGGEYRATVTASQILSLQLSQELGGFTIVGSGGTATYDIQKLRMPHACNDARNIEIVSPPNIAVPHSRIPTQLSTRMPPGAIQDVYMLFGELTSFESYTHDAEGSNGECVPTPLFGSHLLQTWRALHEDEFVTFGDNLMGYEIVNWELPQGPLWARKTIDRSVAKDETTYHELTAFDLFHRPKT